MKFELSKLEELVEILQSHQLNIVRTNSPQTGNKTMKLLDKILEQSYQNESELIQELCKGENQSNRFRYLKNVLGIKLVNAMVNIASTRGESYKSVYNNCYKSFAAIKVLISNGAKNAGISLAVETLKTARRYEITELVYLLSFEIAQHFAMINEGRKRAYYQKMYNRFFITYQAEQHALVSFSDLSLLLSSSKKLQPHELKEVERIVESIQYQHTGNKSYKLNFLRFLTATINYVLKDEYEEVITVGVKAINYFDQLPFKPHRSFYFNFFYYMIPALICKNEYDQIKDITNRCLAFTRKGSYNWSITLFYKVVAGYHAQDYEQVEDTFKQVMRIRHELPDNLLEQWRIIEAYLYLLRGLEKLPENNTRFRIQKFINEVPEYSKDKAGANVTILTLQILLLLLRNKRGKIIDRMDALKMYTYKYLVRDNTYRSQCFIKIILQLERSHFHPVAFKRHASPLLKKMQEMPLRFSDLEVEIIPYEQQYEFIMQLLER